MKKTTVVLATLMSTAVLGGTAVNADEIKAQEPTSSIQAKSWIWDNWTATGGATNNGQGTLARGEWQNYQDVTVNGVLHGHSNNHEDVANVSVTITQTQGCTAEVQDNHDGTFTVVIHPTPGYHGEIFVGLTAMDTDGSQYTPEIRLNEKDTSIDTSHLTPAWQTKDPEKPHGVTPTRPTIDKPDTDNPTDNGDNNQPEENTGDNSNGERPTNQTEQEVDYASVKPQKARTDVSRSDNVNSHKDDKKRTESKSEANKRTLPETGVVDNVFWSVLGTLILFLVMLFILF